MVEYPQDEAPEVCDSEGAGGERLIEAYGVLVDGLCDRPVHDDFPAGTGFVVAVAVSVYRQQRYGTAILQLAEQGAKRVLVPARRKVHRAIHHATRLAQMLDLLHKVVLTFQTASWGDAVVLHAHADGTVGRDDIGRIKGERVL